MRNGLLAAFACVALTMLGGIAPFGGESFAQDRDRLPDRSALLRSDETPCDGVLVIASDREDDDVGSVRRGQSRVFELDHENVRWACLGESETRSDTMECPEDTTHLRISSRNDIATFECYGRV